MIESRRRTTLQPLASLPRDATHEFVTQLDGRVLAQYRALHTMAMQD